MYQVGLLQESRLTQSRTDSLGHSYDVVVVTCRVYLLFITMHYLEMDSMKFDATKCNIFVYNGPVDGTGHKLETGTLCTTEPVKYLGQARCILSRPTDMVTRVVW